MAHGKLAASSNKIVLSAIDKLFDQLKNKFIGPHSIKGGSKGLIIVQGQEKTLGAMVIQSAYAAGAQFSKEVKNSLESIAISYIDAVREKTKAKAVQAIQSVLTSDDDVEKLEEHLQDILETATSDVRRVVETETTTARNMSTIDAITKIAAVREIDDPTVFWITVRDNITCSECKQMYIMPDGITPRVWKQSELLSGYWKKGMSAPCASALHPNDRCVCTLLMPGYGFDQSGFVTYKSPDWDEWKHQRD